MSTTENFNGKGLGQPGWLEQLLGHIKVLESLHTAPEQLHEAHATLDGFAHALEGQDWQTYALPDTLGGQSDREQHVQYAHHGWAQGCSVAKEHPHHLERLAQLFKHHHEEAHLVLRRCHRAVEATLVRRHCV